MKKILFILLGSASFFACSTQNSSNEKQAIGFDMAGGSGRTALFGGDTTNVTLFENFIKALNEKDTAAIRNIDATENLEIYTPEGNKITSADTNIKNLSSWFATNNPAWKLNFCVANSYSDKKGKLHEWVTASCYVTQTIDGKEMKVNQYFDANIENGRIQKMYITERKLTAGE